MAFRRNDRRRFSRQVMQVAYARTKDAAGTPRCQGCTAVLAPGKYVYDHVVPWEIGRDSSLGNCQVICVACDDVKTPQRDLPAIAKSNRVRDAHSGGRTPPRHPMPAGRLSGWKRPIGGGRPVRRLSQVELHARYLASRTIVAVEEV